MDEKKQEQKSEQPKQTEHGENWVTRLYDEANISVNTLNMAAIALIVFIFVFIFVFAK